MTHKKDVKHEIRLRDVDPSLIQEIQKIAQVRRIATATQVIEYLIKNYLSDQSLLKQYQERNNKLHQELRRYQGRESDDKHNLTQVASFLTQVQKQIGEASKQFTVQAKKYGKKSGTKKTR